MGEAGSRHGEGEKETLETPQGRQGRPEAGQSPPRTIKKQSGKHQGKQNNPRSVGKDPKRTTCSNTSVFTTLWKRSKETKEPQSDSKGTPKRTQWQHLRHPYNLWGASGEPLEAGNRSPRQAAAMGRRAAAMGRACLPKCAPDRFAGYIYIYLYIYIYIA